MPKGTKIHRCVQSVMAQGKEKPNAIRICQSATGQSYMTGRTSKRYRRNHNPYTDTSSDKIRSEENFARNGGYGIDGLGPDIDIPPDRKPNPYVEQIEHGGEYAAPSAASGDERAVKMPPRTSGNAAEMVMRIARGSKS